MKIKVSKVDAAKSQLIEAIHLFFEDRDPVSIHTLIGASLEILNDHITDKGIVWDNNLLLHPDTIFIKDECRIEWQNIVRKEKNFFKHADCDLRKGITEIEFDTETNEIYIFETIRTLGVVVGEGAFWPAEFKVFFAWIVSRYPKMFKDDGFVERFKTVTLKTKLDYKKAIDFMNQHPEKFEDQKNI